MIGHNLRDCADLEKVWVEMARNFISSKCSVGTQAPVLFGAMGMQALAIKKNQVCLQLVWYVVATASCMQGARPLVLEVGQDLVLWRHSAAA